MFAIPIRSHSSDVSSVTAFTARRSSACLLSAAIFLPRSTLTRFDGDDIASAAAVIAASLWRAWRSVSSMGAGDCV